MASSSPSTSHALAADRLRRVLAWGALALTLLGAGVALWPRAKVAPVLTVARTNLVCLSGRWYQLPASNLFTGWMVEYYPEGKLYGRCALSNGLLNGVSEGWYTNGQIQIREHYRDSLAEGLRQKWYPNGQLKSEATVVQGKLEGTFRSWHENGRPAEQIEMRDGSPDGEAWAFYESGFVKAETQVQAGKVLSRKSWDDGQFRLASAAGFARPLSTRQPNPSTEANEAN